MKRFLIYISFIFATQGLFGQDTLKVSMQGIDSLFLKNNLLLLAQKYRITGGEALVKQAKLWDNPSLSSELNLYNPSKSKYFDVGSKGEKIVAIDQLIVMAGKRNKRIEIAKAAAQFNSYEFFELMRTLKLELRINYSTIYFNSRTLKKYDDQLGLLQTIISALQFQNTKGNIPLKEVLRLKALYYKLNNDRTELLNEIFDSQKNLQTLLQTNAYIVPIDNGKDLNRYTLSILKRDELITKALNNRPDLKMAESESKQADLNISLQKRLAYPDLHIGGIYDQAGSYIFNYTGVTFGFDIPVLNRNQGNIKYAKAVSDEMKLRLQNKSSEVVNDVSAAFLKLMQVEQEYLKVDSDFATSFTALNEGFITNFQKRNISLFEFTDFFEAYNESILQLNQLNEKRVRSYEELNYVISEELFTF
jgi:cobalt-zinc-cadmium efflux system outer membrane protein